jgi:hypothetical protein
MLFYFVLIIIDGISTRDEREEKTYISVELDI